MIKVAFYDTKEYDKPSFERYGGLHDMQFRFLETKLNEDTVDLARGCDAVCVFVNDTVNAAVIEKLYEYGVKLIALRSAGYNNVDLKAAKGKIDVVRVPKYSPYAVAEHTIGLLLCLNRRIHRAYIRTKDFNFSLNGLTGFDLKGKTVGVVGTGKIGQVFIDICRGFGMKVLAYDIYPSMENVEYTDIDTLCANSDIISLHCPLTKETKHIINKNTISKMKQGVFILNTSRGALINSEHLAESLKDGKIGGAALDVYEEESDIFFEDRSSEIINDDTLRILLSMPNVLITSHQAFLTNEALENIARVTLENIYSYFEKNNITNKVEG